MTTLGERYEEIMALLPDDADLGFDDAPIEAYIMAAAEALGFAHPAAALSLDTSLDDLLAMNVP